MKITVIRAAAVLAAALLVGGAVPVAAQSVKVAFHDGRVDLSADNASIRTILNEWARQGGTRLVNADRINGGPVTLEFKNAYEYQVLETLLRGVSGYLVGPRIAETAAGASGFDRIVILATSTAPRQTNVTPSFPRPPGPQPLRRSATNFDDDQAPAVEADQDEPVILGAPAAPAPASTQTDDVRRRLGQLLQEPDDNPATPGAQVTPSANPFGAGVGSARPGVIAPPPPAPQPEIRTTPRPPQQPQ
jgi:hypothetical protein